MNLQFYLEKMQDSEVYKKFMKENPRAFLCSAFFLINKEDKNQKNQQHFDFFLPKQKKMFSFKLEDNEMVPVDMITVVPEEISMNCDFDFNEMEKLIADKIDEENIREKVQKMFLSLQRKEGKDFLICTVFISKLGLLRINIDIPEKKVTDFEKKSFFDMLKFIRK